MRAGVGLLSLLICVAIIFYVSFGTKNHPGVDAVALEAGKKMREVGEQAAYKIEPTIVLDEVDNGNRQYTGLKVVSVDPGTPMDTYYGLKTGDVILKVGQLGVADNNDAGLGKTLVYGAYPQNQSIVIRRNDQDPNITLTPADSPLSKYGKSEGSSIPIPMH